MDIADLMIHVHPMLSAEQWAELEQTVVAREGVVSIHFNPEYTHLLTVAYNPKEINSKTILEQVRQWDKEGLMAGY
ncbi:MAG: hypothetical protein BMS9Abin33_0256 [Gammaproteobacteria bacterium]|nr:MAG: hypothetical protein BMS9Abin33_0256 [Gammaproteobacteria bacterium]